MPTIHAVCEAKWTWYTAKKVQPVEYSPIMFLPPKKKKNARTRAATKNQRQWPADSPLFLREQHHSMTQIFLLWRMSLVRIQSLAVVHTKKATLGETLALQTLPQERMWVTNRKSRSI